MVIIVPRYARKIISIAKRLEELGIYMVRLESRHRCPQPSHQKLGTENRRGIPQVMYLCSQLALFALRLKFIAQISRLAERARVNNAGVNHHWGPFPHHINGRT